MLCRLTGGNWEEVLSCIVSSSFRYGFDPRFIPCVRILVYFVCMFVYGFQLCVSLLWNYCDTSVYSFDCAFWISWVLLKLWNHIFVKSFEKENKFVKFRLVKRFEKCAGILQLWYMWIYWFLNYRNVFDLKCIKP